MSSQGDTARELLASGSGDEIDPTPEVPRTITEALGAELTEPHQTVASYGGGGGVMRHKRGGGITIAQKLDTAKQPDMPLSAIESGCIDKFDS